MADDTARASLASIDGKVATQTTLAALETKAATETTLASLEAKAATETTLAALNTKVTKADTDNVTVVSSVLPTGGATAANQATGNASLASIDGKVATETTLSALNTKVPAQGPDGLRDRGGTPQHLVRSL